MRIVLNNQIALADIHSDVWTLLELPFHIHSTNKMGIIIQSLTEHKLNHSKLLFNKICFSYSVVFNKKPFFPC